MKIEQIYDIIEEQGFTAQTLQTIDNYIKEIQDGTEDFPRFNLSEHAGFCTAGAPLIGASIIASYATASITASCNAEGSQGGPANWQIDEYQEKLIEQWARAANLWEDNSEQILTLEFGPMIAQGAEAKVYYADGNTSVVKERTSIYSTWQKALDAIVLHNCLFPETIMTVIGFTRDSDGLMRIVLTQPYVNCEPSGIAERTFRCCVSFASLVSLRHAQLPEYHPQGYHVRSEKIAPLISPAL